MTANKIYALKEMRKERIFTGDYGFIDEPGEYLATLELRAETNSSMLRLFFRLTDDRKIITLVFWWQKYLGFYDIANGTKLKLIYEASKRSNYIHLIRITYKGVSAMKEYKYETVWNILRNIVIPAIVSIIVSLICA